MAKRKKKFKEILGDIFCNTAFLIFAIINIVVIVGLVSVFWGGGSFWAIFSNLFMWLNRFIRWLFG